MSICNVRSDRPLMSRLRWWKSMMIVNQINLIKFQRLSNIYIHDFRTRSILLFLSMIVRINFKIVNIVNITLILLSTILFAVGLKFEGILIGLLAMISLLLLEFWLVFLQTLLFMIGELLLTACICIVRIIIFLIVEHINNLIIITWIYNLFNKIIR